MQDTARHRLRPGRRATLPSLGAGRNTCSQRRRTGLTPHQGALERPLSAAAAPRLLRHADARSIGLAIYPDPEHGDIAPTRFIEIAEDSGLIIEIGAWVANAACRH